MSRFRLVFSATLVTLFFSMQQRRAQQPVSVGSTEASETMQLQALTWFVEPADEVAERSVQRICRLIDEYHPDIVFLQNLNLSATEIIRGDKSLEQSYYRLFPKVDPDADDTARVCGILVRQPYSPTQISMVDTGDLSYLTCTVNLVDRRVQVEVATCSLDETDPARRQKQWQGLLAHLETKPRCILGVATFCDDLVTDEQPLVVPMNRGWNDAWLNCDCPEQTEATVDGLRNVLVPEAAHVRSDRILYRMPGRVVANGLLGRKESVEMRTTKVTVPPSTHYGYGVKWQIDVAGFASDKWDHRANWSVAERNAVRCGGSFTAAEFNPAPPEDDTEDGDLIVSGDGLLGHAHAARAIAAGDTKRFMETVKVGDRKVKADQIKQLRAERTQDDLVGTMDAPQIDPRSARKHETIRAHVFNGTDGNTKRLWKGPTANQKKEQAEKERALFEETQSASFERKRSGMLLDPKKELTKTEVLQAVFGIARSPSGTASVADPDRDDRVGAAVVGSYEDQRKKDDDFFRAHQLSGSY